jgi:transcriptional regulator with PAS, ATPase and Fis domain
MDSTPPSTPGETGPAEFRWAAFFQRSTEPIFVLNGRRQILFVNHAWENLAGLSARDVYKRVCRRQRDAEPGSCEAVLNCLSPTRQALAGQPCRVRRLLLKRESPPRMWDVEFTPLLGAHGLLGLIGKVYPLPEDTSSGLQPLPEKLMALRERSVAWHGLAQLPTEIPVMRLLAEQVRLASQSGVAVLLIGEPGSGKEWLARTIHQESPNREGPFISLDCRHLPVKALAWSLFGPPGLAVRRGATLYFKEPSRLPRELQARLCEQSGNVEGGNGPRLLAGAAANLDEEVQAGRLLEDFYCLLSPLAIRVPALRQRVADLPWFVEKFLRRATSGAEQPVTGLTAEAWELIRGHGWPGNLSELYGVLATACRRAKGEKIEAADLPWYLRPGGAPVAERTLPLDKIMEQVERRLVQLAMVMAKGNKSRAAELLEVLRPRLLRRLSGLGIVDSE